MRSSILGTTRLLLLESLGPVKNSSHLKTIQNNSMSLLTYSQVSDRCPLGCLYQFLIFFLAFLHIGPGCISELLIYFFVLLFSQNMPVPLEIRHNSSMKKKQHVYSIYTPKQHICHFDNYVRKVH